MILASTLFGIEQQSGQRSFVGGVRAPDPAVLTLE